MISWRCVDILLSCSFLLPEQVMYLALQNDEFPIIIPSLYQVVFFCKEELSSPSALLTMNVGPQYF